MTKIKQPSPILKQYRELKKKHPEAILLFRCGDFYETYDADASICATILGITLTRRDSDGVNMAGFPYHALDTYLPKLIRAGKRAAICDQLEDPKDKKTVRRGITEVVSPTKENDKPETKPTKTEEEMTKEQEQAIREEYEKQIAELKEESREKMLDIATAVIESYGRVEEIPEKVDNALSCAIGRINLINIKHFGFGHVLNDSDIEYLIDTAKKAVDANL